MKTARAFTYLEVLLVIGIVVIFAALVMPSVEANQKSRAIWSFRVDLRRLAQEAKSKSVDSGHVMALVYDEEAKAVKLVEESPTGEAVNVKSVVIPDSIKASEFSADSTQASGEKWRVPFFPDGSTSGGGIAFDISGTPLSFTVSRASGRVDLLDLPFPDLSGDRWPAGTYVQRT